MRYQIYEAKSVKYDAQQRVGMIPKGRNPIENAGLLRYEDASWQQNDNFIKIIQE